MGASTMSCHAAAPVHETGSAYRTVAVVGPPNSGKTTLFNRLTRLRQKVGNFPGVTVEHHTGYVRDANGEEVALIDLPGVYSLIPKSEDEKVAVDVLTGKMPGMASPDAVIVVLNSTNLHTHLVLAARVIALGLPTLVLLNMADELRKQDGHVDVLALARELGTPVALGQRDHRRRPGGRAEFSFGVRALSRAAGAAGHRLDARLSRVGGARRRPTPAIAVPRLRCGPRGSTRCSCIASGGRLFLRSSSSAFSRPSSPSASRCPTCCRNFSTRPARRSGITCRPACFSRWSSTACGRGPARCWSSCRRFCCCFW